MLETQLLTKGNRADTSDAVLTRRIVAKYPEYQNVLDVEVPLAPLTPTKAQVALVDSRG